MRELSSLRDVQSASWQSASWCISELSSYPQWPTHDDIGATAEVLNTAARITDLRPGDHVTPALRELHWLPVTARIKYKLCLMAHKVTIGQAPRYIADLLTPVAEISVLQLTAISLPGGQD